MPFAKIKDNEDIVRDMETQAILRNDLSIVRKHEARVIEMMKEDNRALEIASIKQDITEMKDILKELVAQRKSR